jgi:hypothetical protein
VQEKKAADHRRYENLWKDCDPENELNKILKNTNDRQIDRKVHKLVQEGNRRSCLVTQPKRRSQCLGLRSSGVDA